MFKCLVKHSAFSTLLLAINIAHAQDLKEIIQYSLIHAPEIKEASAEIESSINRTEQAKAQHWPIVSVIGNQTLSQYHENKSDYKTKKMVPGVKGELNLYSFGAIEADVEKSRKEQEQYTYRYDQARDTVAYTVAELYLKALAAKEAIAVAKNSLARHDRILRDLTTIVSSDEGRESEYVQAQSRRLMVEQDINTYRREMELALSTLSKYTKKPVTEKDLVNPFANLPANTLYKQYTAQNKGQNAAYLASKAELETRQLELKAEERKRLPRINLTGSATTDDREIGIGVTWDILNVASSYSVREKASNMAAAYERLDRINRDLDEQARLAIVGIEQSNVQLKTLKSQITASKKVVDFYQLQFEIARRSLLDVLNAEKDLSSVELAYARTQYDLRLATLDFLYSQGMLAKWAGVSSKAEF